METTTTLSNNSCLKSSIWYPTQLLSTYMDKTISRIQISIAPSTDDNSMLGHASDSTIHIWSSNGIQANMRTFCASIEKRYI